MNSPMSTDEPAAPSASDCESPTETDSQKQLRLFVSMLTIRLLHKCDTLQSRTRERWAAHLKTLVSQTMEGLPVTSSFSADGKDIKKVCKAVQKDLQKKYGSKGLVQAAILQEDAATDAIIAQCLQTHTRAFIAERAKKRSSRSWRDALGTYLAFAGLAGFPVVWFCALLCVFLV
ncbi:hypothetical protein GBF38_005121 [Nibea albiflora]|uniref:Uncharacterized protein n=1 Tax=Nibea albiflora TaxID=240163 RepID=A0ACB7EW57_NIBAL|nr:hypothetical protein GBF38_005121 [Nibea albiflora]